MRRSRRRCRSARRGRACRHHDGRAVRCVRRSRRGRRLSGRDDAGRDRRRGALLWRQRAGFLDCIRAVEHVVRRGFGQLACERGAGRAELFPMRCSIDAGTTTTDLVPLEGGAVAARGYSDGERLAEGELVYTGVVRTPVMAVARTAPFDGRMQRIAAERFATMADVWRLWASFPTTPTPTPRPISRERARRRAQRGLPACSAAMRTRRACSPSSISRAISPIASSPRSRRPRACARDARRARAPARR